MVGNEIEKSEKNHVVLLNDWIHEMFSHNLERYPRELW